MLIGQLNDDIKQIFQSIADGSDFEIEVMETDKDHIHFLIRYIPRLSISQLVRRLKQESKCLECFTRWIRNYSLGILSASK
jgi:putative transposase